ncbi:endonuclease domain-containing protein [Thiohalophilus thiocyanatoxydans]|uniref:Very-short-patch-repair endonuclease n=1 Tax=Thiohalophilus thiocyanatoxydans TaxID=381308 RepID=A0A4R8J1F8_9GAMM|nr:endonuclease domain-containing protein [Thiohalophilus thiocyanatoxydans]TDY04009.1 very-short-patch-repair endonuclease [Thiohalophilus thiocyanatoxydans]
MTKKNEKLPSPAGGRGVGGEGATLRQRAKQLRSSQTPAEELLWLYLRAHRFMGLKFKRQKPIGHYIVDFVCHSPKIIIEIDGGQHVEQEEYDQRRALVLKQKGFTVLRFWNNEVLKETEPVLEKIR